MERWRNEVRKTHNARNAHERITIELKNTKAEKQRQEEQSWVTQQKMATELNRLAAAVGFWKQQTIDLQEAINSQVRKLEAERADWEELVRKAQEGAFGHMKEGKWMPREDGVIRANLKKLEGRIRNWAKTYALQSQPALNSFPQKKLRVSGMHLKAFALPRSKRQSSVGL